MDRNPFPRPIDRSHGPDHLVSHHDTAPPPRSLPAAHSDPFHPTRDSLLWRDERKGNPETSPWPTPQGTDIQQRSSRLQAADRPSHSSPPNQPLPFSSHPTIDQTPFLARRRSLGGAASPLQHIPRPVEPLPPPMSSFATRTMPFPSPPQNAPVSNTTVSTSIGLQPVSPFSGPRNPTNSRAGMSISSILGGNDEQKPNRSPHTSPVGRTSPLKSMQPPPTARARSSSMREAHDRYKLAHGSRTPQPGVFNEPTRTPFPSAFHDSLPSASFQREMPQDFRVYRRTPHEHTHSTSGRDPPMRPNSQPVESASFRASDNQLQREPRIDTEPSAFHPFSETPGALPSRTDSTYIHNGASPHGQTHPNHGSPLGDHAPRSSTATSRFRSALDFGPPMQRGSAPDAGPAPPPKLSAVSSVLKIFEDPIGVGAHDMRRELSQPLPGKDMVGLEAGRRDYRMPLTAGHRVDLINRELPQHKDSDGTVHRAILNIGSELSRKGRSSPLPQAVQGAQPRHIGPGGDNPGIKMEFGRMFSGLGSGVGSTPHTQHAVTGTGTPSRMSPARHVDSGEFGRAPDLDERRSASIVGPRHGRQPGRRAREDMAGIEAGGRTTPDMPFSNKRLKTTHPPPPHYHHVHPHHHHHHHHHHDAQDHAAGSHNSMSRYATTPQAQATVASGQGHHHHHHAHPGHHHHRNPRGLPAPRKPSITVSNGNIFADLATKPRQHLGSGLYSTEIRLPSVTDVSAGSSSKFCSRMRNVPKFEGKENCTFMIRIPRYFLSRSDTSVRGGEALQEVCKRRQLWGTEVYTDDSDVIAAAVHSGWLAGDFGSANNDLRDLGDANLQTAAGEALTLATRPSEPVKVPDGHDAHITVLILPPLESYASTHQHHVWSREWDKTHDGMSFTIHKIEFVNESATNRYIERNAASRKKRIAAEEAARHEAATGLLMISAVSVGA